MGVVVVSVVSETERAVAAALADGSLTVKDAGVVEALMHVAREIDSLVHGVNGAGKLDNVSVPTYLKFSEALGLTPSSRVKFAGAMARASAQVKDSGGDQGGEDGAKVSSLEAVRKRAGRKQA